MPFLLIFGLYGFPSELALYGLETQSVYSSVGMLLTSIFIMKAFVAIGLWYGKDWAIIVGQLDAIIGILICLTIMIASLINKETSFYPKDIRLELILLIPFLIKLTKIKIEWFNELKYKSFLEV